jgi:hypothetical protein
VKLPKNLGMTLLAIWLILQGLLSLVGFSFPGREIVMAALAIAAGILLLLKR